MVVPQIVPKRKTGKENLTYNKNNQKASLIDFWKWSSSDLLSNATRGVLAEFIVAMTLNQHKRIRTEWEPYDFESKEGIKIEVKSAAYIQSWSQKDYSKIIFTIRPTRAWDPATNKLQQEIKRQADIYVFALLKHLDTETINPLDLNQWTFYLLSTKRIDESMPTAKTLSLKKLKSMDPIECSYKRLRQYIKKEYKICHNQLE